MGLKCTLTRGDRYLKIKPWRPKTSINPDAPSSTEKIPAKEKGHYEKPPEKAAGYLRAYIGNLSWDVDESVITEFFAGCSISAIKFAEDRETGEFKGYGHVDFEDDESLEKAVAMDQTPLLGRPMKIAYAVSKQGEGGVRQSGVAGRREAEGRRRPGNEGGEEARAQEDESREKEGKVKKDEQGEMGGAGGGEDRGEELEDRPNEIRVKKEKRKGKDKKRGKDSIESVLTEEDRELGKVVGQEVESVEDSGVTRKKAKKSKKGK